MPQLFESVQMQKPRMSAFDLSHEKKLSCSMGELIPILCEEIIPGDQFNVSTEVMIRFSPMIAPVMHRVNVFVHYFFVPNRIIWTSWEDFITGGKDGTSAPVIPTVTQNAQINIGSLGDYLGAGYAIFGGTSNEEINALSFRAYQQIYNDYYRDETLTDEVVITTEAEVVLLRTRQWEKDYFTSALPWTQRGPNTPVPITFDPTTGEPSQAWDVFATPPALNTVANSNIDIDSSGNVVGADTGAGRKITALDNTDSLNLLVNDLRTATRLQRWLEKQARGGYRYIETILSHFGVKSSDQRLQRAEYLGGGRQPVVMSEVLNSSATATEAQGTMAGHGISVGTANSMRKRFEEHGFLFGIMSVIPRTNYFQGIRRHLSRTDKLDYFWPEFAHLGEQEVLQKEIYVDKLDTDAANNAVFGYQQRYAEYKYGCSSVHGDFRSTLDFWTLTRKFATRPVLNNAFTESDPSTRIFAVETGDTLWCQIYNNVRARRPIPYFADPRL